jgi:transposase
MSQLKIKKNKEKIVKLLNENIDLQYNLNLKTFKSFSEKMVNIGTKKEPKQVVAKIGHWVEWFKDEDRPNEKGVKIKRSEIYEIDGMKTDHWNRIKYYSIDDV